MNAKVFGAYTGSSIGKTFCVSADIEPGFHDTDCGRKLFFKTLDDLKDYWNEKYSSTSFLEMSYSAVILRKDEP